MRRNGDVDRWVYSRSPHSLDSEALFDGVFERDTQLALSVVWSCLNTK